MKRNLLFFIVFLIGTLGSLAQTAQSFTVEGILMDSLTKQAEPFATVRIMRSGSATPVSVVLSDATGKFKLSAKKAGTYQLVCSNVGKKTVQRTLSVTDASGINVGTILMAANETMLGAVTVKAQRPIVKAEVDKLTYSMADDPDAQTNTLIEMLRKVPMVTVDGEDNIQVNGNSSFKVYVNGKPNQMMSSNPSEVFKSYPASAIKKIEVITNPGAKYDAEGVAGVLNIITNTETTMKGYSFTPNLRVDNNSTMGSFFGMAQFGKFTMSAHYGLGHFSPPSNSSWSEREVFDEPTNHLLRSDGTGKSSGTFQFGSLDGSYEFDTHNLLSFSAGVHGHSNKTNSDNAFAMSDLEGNNVYSYNQHSYSRSSNTSFNASMDYQHTFKEDQTLTFSYQMNTSPSESRSISTYMDLVNIPFELTDLYSSPDNQSYEHTGQLDFTTPLSERHKLSTGIKYIYRINKSDNTEKSRVVGTDDDFVVDDDRSLLYRHRGDIAAAYAEYNYKWQAFSAMAGARYEYYHIKVTYPDGKRPAFSTDMGDLVPSVRAGYNLSPTQMLKFGYSMRIERPGIGSLSPYVNRPTPESRSYGNPNLESSKAHNIETGYSLFGTKFSVNTTLTYSFSNNGLTSYSFMDADGVQNTTNDNFLHSKALNLGVFMNWTIVDGTAVNLNGGANYRDLKVYRTGDHNFGFGAHCWGGITQQLPAKLKAELWLGYSSREVQLQGNGSTFYMYSLNLSRTFLKENRLRLSLRAGNFIGRYRHFRNETLTETFRTTSSTKVDFMRLGIGISYRLGSLNAQVKKAARSIENNDVQQSSGSSSEQGGDAGGVQN